MPRLPIPGSDDDTWGAILNEYLNQSHNSDGTAKDASTTSKGVVQLAGDLGGTAEAPTVPGKASSSVTITGATSLTGGGNLTANRTLSLVNDTASPGNSRYYGTNGSGTKGFHALPASDPAVGGDLSGTVSNAQIVSGAVTITELASAVAQALTPAGAVTPFAGASTPAGWLACDGSAVSRTTYATLFSAIGTAYGSGDGSTTFNLPNLRGKVPVGQDASQAEFDALGETGGAKTHTLTEAEMPAHDHTSTPSGTNNFIRWVGSSGNVSLTSGAQGIGQSLTITTSSTGGGAAHNNLQPYIVMNYIIKT